MPSELDRDMQSPGRFSEGHNRPAYTYDYEEVMEACSLGEEVAARGPVGGAKPGPGVVPMTRSVGGRGGPLMPNGDASD